MLFLFPRSEQQYDFSSTLRIQQDNKDWDHFNLAPHGYHNINSYMKPLSVCELSVEEYATSFSSLLSSFLIWSLSNTFWSFNKFVCLDYSLFEWILLFELKKVDPTYNTFSHLQLANHLDRAVSSIGRQPLKVLVQVNTSGEECECIFSSFLFVDPERDWSAWQTTLVIRMCKLLGCWHFSKQYD